MGARQLERDLGARVARPHDEDAAVPELRRVAVLAGVQLDDGRIELLRECRPPGSLPVGHRDHDVVGLEPPIAGGQDEPVAVLREPVDLDTGLHGELKPRGVGLQVVRHLVLRGERVARGGEGHPVKPVVAGGREQAQRVPSASPRIADPLVGVEDHEGEFATGQVVAGRETRLAAAHDHGLDALCRSAHRCCRLGHARLLPSFPRTEATPRRRRGPSGVLPIPRARSAWRRGRPRRASKRPSSRTRSGCDGRRS